MFRMFTRTRKMACAPFVWLEVRFLLMLFGYNRGPFSIAILACGRFIETKIPRWARAARCAKVPRSKMQRSQSQPHPTWVQLLCQVYHQKGSNFHWWNQFFFMCFWVIFVGRGLGFSGWFVCLEFLPNHPPLPKKNKNILKESHFEWSSWIIPCPTP